MGTVIPFPYTPSPERLAVIYAAVEEAWPEYERALEKREAEEREIATMVAICPPRLRLVR